MLMLGVKAETKAGGRLYRRRQRQGQRQGQGQGQGQVLWHAQPGVLQHQARGKCCKGGDRGQGQGQAQGQGQVLWHAQPGVL